MRYAVFLVDECGCIDREYCSMNPEEDFIEVEPATIHRYNELIGLTKEEALIKAHAYNLDNIRFLEDLISEENSADMIEILQESVNRIKIIDQQIEHDLAN